MPASSFDHPSAPEPLRRLMLAAAREILREDDTPLDLRKVAERAGKSRTAPYLVFGKESEGGGVLALRIAVAAEGAREMADAMAAAAEGHDDPIEGFQAVALAFLDFVSAESRLFRLMYGPEIQAVARLGEDGFRDHPEFSRLLEHRTRAGHTVGALIQRGQRRGLLRPELRGGSAVEELLETPYARYLQIAWSTMIGTALLRDDQLLRAIEWRISREQGARLIVESVFGLDPDRMGAAADAFLAARGVTVAARDPSLGQALAHHSGLRRAAFSERLRRRPRIVWIDDHPESVRAEVQMLEWLGADVTLAESTTAAQRLLRLAARGEAAPVDLVVSDIARAGGPDAGVRALPAIARLAPTVPVIFFVDDLDPSRGVPAGATGITNRTDELLHLVVDALERHPPSRAE